MVKLQRGVQFVTIMPEPYYYRRVHGICYVWILIHLRHWKSNYSYFVHTTKTTRNLMIAGYLKGWRTFVYLLLWNSLKTFNLCKGSDPHILAAPVPSDLNSAVHPDSRFCGQTWSDDNRSSFLTVRCWKANPSPSAERGCFSLSKRGSPFRTMKSTLASPNCCKWWFNAGVSPGLSTTLQDIMATLQRQRKQHDSYCLTWAIYCWVACAWLINKLRKVFLCDRWFRNGWFRCAVDLSIDTMPDTLLKTYLHTRFHLPAKVPEIYNRSAIEM